MEYDLEPKYGALLAEAERQGLSDVEGMRLCMGTLSLATLIERQHASSLAPHGLSEGRFSLMFMLEPYRDGLSPHVLADQAGVARATVTGLVDGMVRDGLVERHDNPKDRRSNLVVLTRKGRNLIRKVFNGQARQMARSFDALSQTERRQFGRLLAKLGAPLQPARHRGD